MHALGVSSSLTLRLSETSAPQSRQNRLVHLNSQFSRWNWVGNLPEKFLLLGQDSVQRDSAS